MEGILDFFSNYGSLGLGILSFIESFFFPIPPDVLLIPMALANPEQALWFAAIVSVASVLGGMLGYLIGVFAGRPLLKRWVSPESMLKIQDLFQRYGGWAVAIAGFSPIPYKIFTISAGVFRINKITFILASIISRSARFFLEALLIIAIGEKAIALLENYFGLITVSICFVLVLVVWLFKRISR
ncbi:YqaA family protein [Desulfotomaculum sp. 1211_IL3151]|uniref:YqaA family protein n=1 Tax=Desulfotomaculum sp. 1211_IL3151 TaxID=3084055 RepID=UPI002FDA97D0